MEQGKRPSVGTDTDLFEETARLRARTLNEEEGKLPDFFCPRCRNKGYFALAEGARVVVKPCSCAPRRRSLRLLRESGLSSLLERCSFARFETPEPWQREAKALAEAYAERPDGRWFLACGTPGSGKTHLCTAICARFLAEGRAVRYMLWRDEAVRLKAAVTDAAEYDRLISPLKRAEVLYIDDFWKTDRRADPTPGDVNLAFELISHREREERLPTLLSCERTLPELLRVDEAVGGRICRRTRGCRVTVRGKWDWRLRDGANE